MSQPFSPSLEEAVIVSVEKIIAAAKAVMAGRPIPPRRPPIGGPSSRSGVRLVPPLAPVEPPVADAPVTGAPDNATRPALDGIPLRMPNLDLTVTEGTVVRWLKQVGDPVALNEVLVEVETAKAIVPVESPTAGVLDEISVREGGVALIGQALGTVRPVSPQDIEPKAH